MFVHVYYVCTSVLVSRNLQRKALAKTAPGVTKYDCTGGAKVCAALIAARAASSGFRPRASVTNSFVRSVEKPA
jgi:hypothetical protein